MQKNKLFTPMIVGQTCLANRVWMAPMTRSRAENDGTPTRLMAEYYAQRVGAGLIVSEATQISRQGQGYARTPGIHADRHITGWQRVTQAVHARGSKMVLQLWHVGRVSHHLLQPDGGQPVAPSAIRAENTQCSVILPDGNQTQQLADTPRALSHKEIPGIIMQYADAAACALEAGFDLIEVHAANGYLLNQFLDIKANQREGEYGGSLENRARIVLETIEAIAARIGIERIGIRLSPLGVFNDMSPEDNIPMSLYLAHQLDQRGIAYLHIAEPDWAGGKPLDNEFRRMLRRAFGNVLVFCGNYDVAHAEHILAANLADAIAFGRPFIANPDLVERMRHSLPLTQFDPNTLYGGDAHGYTDYPTPKTDSE